jgi:hypothetical protein
MKKQQNSKKLVLDKITIAPLTDAKLATVAGGQVVEKYTHGSVCADQCC